MAWVKALATTPEGRLVSAADDRTLRVWDMDTYKETHVLRRHMVKVRAGGGCWAHRGPQGCCRGPRPPWSLPRRRLRAASRLGGDMGGEPAMG